MTDIEKTLAERGSNYGDFRDNAAVSQGVKDAMRRAPGWEGAPPYVRDGFDMIAAKIARALTGNPLFDDNFHDIVGYARIMQDRAAQDRMAGAAARIVQMGDEDDVAEAAKEDLANVIAEAVQTLKECGFTETVSGTLIDRDGNPPSRALEVLRGTREVVPPTTRPYDYGDLGIAPEHDWVAVYYTDNHRVPLEFFVEGAAVNKEGMSAFAFMLPERAVKEAARLFKARMAIVVPFATNQTFPAPSGIFVGNYKKEDFRNALA